MKDDRRWSDVTTADSFVLERIRQARLEGCCGDWKVLELVMREMRGQVNPHQVLRLMKERK